MQAKEMQKLIAEINSLTPSEEVMAATYFRTHDLENDFLHEVAIVRKVTDEYMIMVTATLIPSVNSHGLRDLHPEIIGVYITNGRDHYYRNCFATKPGESSADCAEGTSDFQTMEFIVPDNLKENAGKYIDERNMFRQDLITPHPNDNIAMLEIRLTKTAEELTDALWAENTCGMSGHNTLYRKDFYRMATAGERENGNGRYAVFCGKCRHKSYSNRIDIFADMDPFKYITCPHCGNQMSPHYMTARGSYLFYTLVGIKTENGVKQILAGTAFHRRLRFENDQVIAEKPVICKTYLYMNDHVSVIEHTNETPLVPTMTQSPEQVINILRAAEPEDTGMIALCREMPDMNQTDIYGISKYMLAYYQLPQIRKFVEAHMTRCVEDLMNKDFISQNAYRMNLRADNIRELLKIKPSLLKTLERNGLEQVSLKDIWTYQEWKDLDDRLSLDTIRELMQDGFKPENFRIRVKNIQVKLTTRIFPYLKNQQKMLDEKKWIDCTFKDIAIMWTEYIWLAQRKGIDLQKRKNLFPEDLVAAFDNVFENYFINPIS